MKKHKNKIIAGLIIIIVMAVAFFYGGNSPDTKYTNEITKNTEVSSLTSDFVNIPEDDEKENTTEIKNKENPSEEKKDNPSDTEEKKDNPSDTEDKKEEDIKESEILKETSVLTPSETDLSDVKEEVIETLEIQKPETINSDVDKINQTTNSKEDIKTADTDKAPEKLLPVSSNKENTQPTQPEKKEETKNNLTENKTSENKKPNVTDEASEKKDKYQTDPVPLGKPKPVEPQNITISDKELTCTLSVRCDTILNNMNLLDKEKVSLVPEDGVIFAQKIVTFYEGESVFNVLLREMKRNKIHMEFVNTPIYNSAYIEGIGNLYEFDCGELSGWMYKVNGWFPNYGCSRYQLKAGDKIEWVYTCDLGADVGGDYLKNRDN